MRDIGFKMLARSSFTVEDAYMILVHHRPDVKCDMKSEVSVLLIKKKHLGNRNGRSNIKCHNHIWASGIRDYLQGHGSKVT